MRVRFLPLLGLLPLAACERGPEHTLEEIARALQSNDKVAFENHFDLPRVAGSADGEHAFRSEVSDPLFTAGSRFEGDDGRATSRLARLFREEDPDGVEYQGVRKSQVNVSNATLGLALHFPGLDTTFVHDIELEKVDGRWKVVSLGDLKGMERRVQAVQTTRIETANEAIRTRMAEHLSVGGIKREVRHEQQGLLILPSLYVIMPVTNRGDHPVSGVEITATFAGRTVREAPMLTTRHRAQTLTFAIRDTLAPGETRVLERRVEMDWNNQAFKAGPTSHSIDRVVVLGAAGADTIRPYQWYWEYRQASRESGRSAK